MTVSVTYFARIDLTNRNLGRRYKMADMKILEKMIAKGMKMKYNWFWQAGIRCVFPRSLILKGLQGVFEFFVL